MATKEEWVARFEELYERKPSPQEFLEGKRSNFDLDSFLLKEHRKDEVVNKQASLKQPTPDVPSKEQWLTTFEKRLGRKPTSQEFLQGKKSQFALTTIDHFLISPLPTKEKVSKPRSIGRKILFVLVGVVIVGAVGGYFWGNQYFSKEAVAKRYIKAFKEDPKQAITEYEVWSDTKETITKEQLTYLNKAKEQILANDAILDESHMVQVGHQFLVFPKWKVAVEPVDAKIRVNTKGLALFVNDKEIEKSTGASYEKELKRLYPGTYSFVAKGKVDGQDVEVSSQENLVKNSEIDLAIEYLSFTVQSNLLDGDLYVGSRKIGTLQNGRFEITNLAVTSAGSIYVQKDFSENMSLKTEPYAISDIANGSTIRLNASGVLDRDVADRVITAAYHKLSDYSSSHTTPDNLKDVFVGGAENNFYSDVKETIDTNTTGAKNRSADAIRFSDVDVTKVTQTGAKTYTVEFTVVYDFYYGYNSQFKTSGDIIQKLAWSANVEFVGDKDTDGSYFSDYRIVSKAGSSSLLDTKNTVN